METNKRIVEELSKYDDDEIFGNEKVEDMEINILLDQDGVIANFVDRACKLLGEDPSKITDWDISKCLNIDPSEMWRVIDKDLCFWENLEPYSWNNELISLLEEFSSNIFICTSPSMNSDCAAQKLNWIKTYLPRKYHRSFIITPHKHLLAREGNVLIDDSISNCSKFRINGGKAILFPQPWNVENGEAPFSKDEKLGYIRRKLEQRILKV